MSLYPISLVVCFEKRFKDQVLEFLSEQKTDLIQIEEDKEGILLVFNATKTNNIYEWLDQTLAIVNYDKYKAFYKLNNRSLFHLYLAPTSIDEKFALNLSAQHLLLFYKLGVIMDIDYGIGFEF